MYMSHNTMSLYVTVNHIDVVDTAQIGTELKFGYRGQSPCKVES